MRILFFSHYFPPEGNAPAARTHAHTKRWAAAGHDVTVVTCAPNVPDGKVYAGYRNSVRPQREVIDGVTVIRIWTFIAANRGFGRRILNYVSYLFSATWLGMTLRRPDVFVATSPQFFCGWAGVLFKAVLRCRSLFLKRTPFVLEVRDIWPESIGAVGALQAGPVLRVLEFMEQIMYRAADQVVTVGDGYKARLMERGVPDRKIAVVTNGVDMDLIQAPGANSAAAAAVREQWQLGDRFVCSYVGTVGMASGLSIVLRAGELLQAEGDDSIVFLIVGDGAIKEGLQDEVKRKGLANVVFTGRQPREQVPNFLATSNACLIHLRATPLFETVIPSKFFEAAGMGKPILMGVKGVAADLVKQSGAGITFAPENEVELLAGVRQLRGQSRERQVMEENGKRFVREHYDRDKLAAVYLAGLGAIVRGEPFTPVTVAGDAGA